MLKNCKKHTTTYNTISYLTLKDKSFCLINLGSWNKSYITTLNNFYLLIQKIAMSISIFVPENKRPFLFTVLINIC